MRSTHYPQRVAHARASECRDKLQRLQAVRGARVGTARGLRVECPRTPPQYLGRIPQPGAIERDKAMLSNFNPTKQLKHPWQRLFAVEYTDYRPVEFNKFIAHPEKYQARGPRKANG